MTQLRKPITILSKYWAGEPRTPPNEGRHQAVGRQRAVIKGHKRMSDDIARKLRNFQGADEKFAEAIVSLTHGTHQEMKVFLGDAQDHVNRQEHAYDAYIRRIKNLLPWHRRALKEIFGEPIYPTIRWKRKKEAKELLDSIRENGREGIIREIDRKLREEREMHKTHLKLLERALTGFRK